jgi:DNA-directed RNA polymerase sigma subunit (sigma70/sigma32)
VTEETLEDVGKRFAITRERVRQIQNQALLKLRAMLEEVQLPGKETPTP